MRFAAVGVERENCAMPICGTRKRHDVFVHGKGSFLQNVSQKYSIALARGGVLRPCELSTKIVQFVSVKHVNHTMFLCMDSVILILFF